jgi:hypothetical protein
MTGCNSYRKAQEAEALLREGLNESTHEMALMDAASLGNVITSLVRWQHRHFNACPYCAAWVASEALAGGQRV